MSKKAESPEHVGSHGKERSIANSGAKKSNAVGALLKNKHPELFYIAPRPGGFLRNIGAPRHDPSRIDVKEEDSASKVTRTPQSHHHSQQLGVQSLKHATVRDILETNIRCPNVSKLSKEEERNNAVRMCSVSISTVMMLAQHSYGDITLEHVKHTEEYFKSLKQEDGYPQNIGQVMQVLATLKRTGQIVTPPPDQEDDSEEDDIGDLIN